MRSTTALSIALALLQGCYAAHEVDVAPIGESENVDPPIEEPDAIEESVIEESDAEWIVDVLYQRTGTDLGTHDVGGGAARILPADDRRCELLLDDGDCSAYACREATPSRNAAAFVFGHDNSGNRQQLFYRFDRGVYFHSRLDLLEPGGRGTFTYAGDEIVPVVGVEVFGVHPLRRIELAATSVRAGEGLDVSWEPFDADESSHVLVSGSVPADATDDRSLQISCCFSPDLGAGTVSANVLSIARARTAQLELVATSERTTETRQGNLIVQATSRFAPLADYSGYRTYPIALPAP